MDNPSGEILRLEFTKFAVEYGPNCEFDNVIINDGDGTTLMEKSCGDDSLDPSGAGYFLPPIILSRSNRVEILFHTDRSKTGAGWSLSWSAVTPGLNLGALLTNFYTFQNFHNF